MMEWLSFIPARHPRNAHAIPKMQIRTRLVLSLVLVSAYCTCHKSAYSSVTCLSLYSVQYIHIYPIIISLIATTNMLCMQNNAYSTWRMQHLLHLITVMTTRSSDNNPVVFGNLRKRLGLTEQLSDILDALRLLLVFAHHAQGRSEEFLAVLHL